MFSKKWLLPVAALAAAFTLLAAGCGGGDGGEEQLLRINIGAEPPSLDPALAVDNISSFVLQQIMDPLVRLDQDSRPVPALAESWDLNGTQVVYHLRQDGEWTNGDPVTANDFEYAWKRILAPELAAEYAYQLWGIEGGFDYSKCDPETLTFAEGHKQAGKPCDPAALRDAVGVRAVDDYTLEVTLTSPQPWFIAQSAHQSFYPVHQATVEEFADSWTEPENIVTSGPFVLTAWEHDSSLTLEKWQEWRDADSVTLTRVEARMIADPVTALQAFEADELDACLDSSCIPPQEVERVKETPEYVQVANLATYFYGINLDNVPDLNQRRALSFAIDRQGIIDNVTKLDQIPATGMTPQGMPGYDVYKQDFLPTTADLEMAKEYLAKAKSPKMELTLFYNNAPSHREIAVAVQSQWKELGIDVELKQQEWAQFLELVGPPPDKVVDAFRFGWLGDYVDAFNFLELWTCGSGNNSTNFCDPGYDQLVEQARSTPDDEQRYEIYRQLEAKLFGPEGALPIIPIYWYTTNTLRKTSVEGWTPNLLAQYDLTKVRISK